MSSDDLMIALVLLGMTATVAHFRVEYVRWRQAKSAELRRETSLRALHTERLVRPADDSPAADMAANSDTGRYPAKNKIAA